MAYRIYSREDGETDVTPRDISDLPGGEQIDFIRSWFRAMFEDPQHEMPYAEKESPYNYRYLWGGPYDARDEIHDAFAGLASEEAIEAVTEEMLQEGPFEWAPSNHPERRAFEQEAQEEADSEHSQDVTLEEIDERIARDIQPSFGNANERQEREALRREIAELRLLLADKSPGHAGIGHNQPPAHLTLDIEEQVEVVQAIDGIETELARETPNIAAVAASAGTLRTVLNWIGKKIDKGVDSFVGAIGTAAGVAVVAGIAGVPVIDKIMQVFNATLAWLNGVTLPF